MNEIIGERDGVTPFIRLSCQREEWSGGAEERLVKRFLRISGVSLLRATLPKDARLPYNYRRNSNSDTHFKIEGF